MPSLVLRTLLDLMFVWSSVFQMSCAVAPGNYDVWQQGEVKILIQDVPNTGPLLWTFTAPVGSKINFKFVEFSFDETAILEIGDGIDATTDRTLATLGGRTKPGDVVSVSNEAWLRLVQVPATQALLDLTITAIQHQAHELIDREDSRIIHVMSQNLPANYANNAYTLWNVKGPNGYTIHIEILLIDLYEGPGDYLYIGDGASSFHRNGAGWNEYLGNDKSPGDPRKFIETGPDVTVIFTSDGAGSGLGFWLELSLVSPPPTTPFADSWKRITIESVLCAVYIGWVIFLWRVHVRFRRAQKADSKAASRNNPEDGTTKPDKAKEIESPGDASKEQSSGPIYVYATSAETSRSPESASLEEKRVTVGGNRATLETDGKRGKDEVKVTDEEGYLVPMMKKSYMQGKSQSVSFSKKGGLEDATDAVKYEQIPYDIQQEEKQNRYQMDMLGGLNVLDPLDKDRSHGLGAVRKTDAETEGGGPKYQCIDVTDPSGCIPATGGAARGQYPDARAHSRHTSAAVPSGTGKSANPGRVSIAMQKTGSVAPPSKDGVPVSSSQAVLIHTYHDPKIC